MGGSESKSIGPPEPDSEESRLEKFLPQSPPELDPEEHIKAEQAQ